MVESRANPNTASPLPTLTFSSHTSKILVIAAILKNEKENQPQRHNPRNNPSSPHVSTPRTLSLIECLPVELLVDVFIQSRSTPKVSTDHGPFDDTIAQCQRKVPNWAPLMSVCHRFCDVIIATPSMWYRIPVTKNLGELRRRLKRSGEHPLDLLLNDSCNDSAVSILLRHVNRIRTIATAPSFGPHSVRALVPIFKAALPILEEVYILPKMNGLRHDRSWISGTNLALHKALHPRVKRLSADRDILPPPESTFWSLQLVHLDLLSQEVTIERRNDILKILRATPVLESLTITFPHTLPVDDDVAHLLGFAQAPPSPQGQHAFAAHLDTPTLMPCLRALKLSGPITHCKAILHAFDMPALDKLFINTSPGVMDLNGSIVDMFPARLRRLLAQHTRLHIHAMPDGGGFRLGDCLCDTGRVSSDRFYLRVQSFRWGLTIASPLRLLRSIFADARLERLEVSYFVREAGGESLARWREVLQTFGGLKRITLRGNDRRAGGTMASDIRALQEEGMSPALVLLDENTDW